MQLLKLDGLNECKFYCNKKPHIFISWINYESSNWTKVSRVLFLLIFSHLFTFNFIFNDILETALEARRILRIYSIKWLECTRAAPSCVHHVKLIGRLSNADTLFILFTLSSAKPKFIAVCVFCCSISVIYLSVKQLG